MFYYEQSPGAEFYLAVLLAFEVVFLLGYCFVAATGRRDKEMSLTGEACSPVRGIRDAMQDEEERSRGEMKKAG